MTPDGSPWTVATVRKHAEGLHETLVEMWQATKDLPPLAFLVLADGRCILVPDVYEVPKDILPAVLRTLAAQHGAQYVGFAADAWSTHDTTPEEVEAWYASGKRLSEHPKANRTLVLSVDGPGLSDVTITTLDADGVPVTEVSTQGTTGRLTNLSGRLGEN